MRRFATLVFLFSVIPFAVSAQTQFQRDFLKGLTYNGGSTPDSILQYQDFNFELYESFGVNTVAIVPRWYVDDASDETIEPVFADEPWTETRPWVNPTLSDEQIIGMISSAKSRGMKVVLKPHVESFSQEPQQDRGWLQVVDGNFQIGRWNELFDSYTAFMLHYARMAEDTGVDLLVIGTELSSMMYAPRADQRWKLMIAELRGAYTGLMTYSSCFCGFVDQTFSAPDFVPFWRELDYIGFEIYRGVVPETDTNPSIEDLKAGIKTVFDDYAKPLADSLGMRIIVSEIWYRPIDGSASDPWKFGGGALDYDEQADLFQAFLEVVDEVWIEDYVDGVIWWDGKFVAPEATLANTPYCQGGVCVTLQPSGEKLRDHWLDQRVGRPGDIRPAFPADEARVASSGFDLAWFSPESGTEFSIELSPDPEFTSPLMISVAADTVTTISDPGQGETLWWRVRNIATSRASASRKVRVNTPPQFASGPVVQTLEDERYSVIFRASDLENDTVSFDLITAPTWLVLTDTSEGSATLEGTPSNEDVGVYQVHVKITDGFDETSLEFELTVSNVNDSPITSPDSVVTSEDVEVVIDVLSNDTDIDGDLLVVSALGEPANGTASALATDSLWTVVYTPALNFSGTDTLSYYAGDLSGAVTAGLVTIDVLPVPDPPPAPVLFLPGSSTPTLLSGDPQQMLEFSWQPVVDPDGDEVTYSWLLSTLPTFADTLLFVDSTAVSSISVTFGELAGLLSSNGVETNTTVELYHRATATDGVFITEGVLASFAVLRGAITGTEDEEIPTEFAVSSVYPNPASGTITFQINLPRSATIDLNLYDVLGRAVYREHLDGQAAGTAELNVSPARLASGIYYWRVSAGDWSETGPLIIAH
jgi:Glycoside Hydrolase Family 113/Bacterial Ig domain/Secretion system C-terminal sorting domain/Putative Ig domain